MSKMASAASIAALRHRGALHTKRPNAGEGRFDKKFMGEARPRETSAERTRSSNEPEDKSDLLASLGRLRKLLAGDSEGYFEQADTDGTGMLTFEKLQSSLGTDVDMVALRVLFDEMDASQDGRISMMEFNQALAADKAFIPPRARWVHSGNMNKKIAAKGKSLQTRFTVLTCTNLYFSKHYDITGGGPRAGKEFADAEIDDMVIIQAFKSLDRDGNGVVDRSELKAALQELNLFTTEDIFDKLWTSLDTDCSGALDVERFTILGRRSCVSCRIIDSIALDEVQAVESQELENGNLEVRVLTTDEGRNRGRVYVYDLPWQEGQEWVSKIRHQVSAAREFAAHIAFREEYGNSQFEMLRARTRMMHESNAFQFVLAFFIVAGFIVDVVEAQVLPERGTRDGRIFMYIDLVVTSAFVLELLVNLFAHSNNCFRPFYSKWSNWSDAIIVVVSVAAVVVSFSGQSDAGAGGAKLLRLLRVGRVIRLFKAFKALRQLLEACAHALVPVGNAFFILLIVSMVYAIMGTTFFADRSPEYFGGFHTSLFTMFDVLMGNIGIARELFVAGGDDERRKGAGTMGSGGATQADVALFFVTYTLINAVMMMNVVVAVLCDGFVQQVTQAKEEEERMEMVERERRKVKGCIDALTDDLVTFEDVADLEGKIHTLYNELDEDNSGGLSYEEFRQMAIQLVSTISLTRDDWNIITENGKHLGPDGEFNQDQFLDMMKGELLRYSRRQLNNVLTVSGDETDRAVILMLKLFEADSKASLEKQQASLAKQQASLAKQEDKLVQMQQDIQTVLQLLQGGCNWRPGMNPVDAGSPKGFSAELSEISDSNALDADLGFMVGTDKAVLTFRHSLGACGNKHSLVPTSAVPRIFETESFEEDEEQKMPAQVCCVGKAEGADGPSRKPTSDTGPTQSSLRGSLGGKQPAPNSNALSSIEFRPMTSQEVDVMGSSVRNEGGKTTDTFVNFGSAVIVHPYLTSQGHRDSASLGRVVGYDFKNSKWAVKRVDVWGNVSESLVYKCGDDLTLMEEHEVYSDAALKAAKQAILEAGEVGEEQIGKLHAEYSRVLMAMIEKRRRV